MHRIAWIGGALALSSLTALMGCGRQPCGEFDGTEGPNVRLDIGLDTCNATPVAVIAGGLTGRLGSLITLDGSGSSDLNGESLTYTWSFTAAAGSSAELIVDGDIAEFTPEVHGTYTVELIVSDGELTSFPATNAVIVKNNKPIANAGADFTTTSSSVVFDGSLSSDADGEGLTYAWAFVTRQQGSNAVLVDANAERPSATLDLAGIYEVELRVHDGFEESNPDTVMVGLGVGNQLPVANAGPDRDVHLGETVMLDGSQSFDVERDPITYRWRLNRAPSGSAAMLNDTTVVNPRFVADVAGPYEVELVVSDPTGQSLPSTILITTSTVPLGAGLLNPYEVYIMGPLRGSRTVGVACSAETGRVQFAGLVGEKRVIRRSDRAMLYLATAVRRGEVLQVIPDAFEYNLTTFNSRYLNGEPADNDVTINTPMCPANVRNFLINPRTSKIIYQCVDDSLWYDMNSVEVPVCEPSSDNNRPLALGYDGSMLCSESILDRDGVTTTIPRSNGYRALPGGGFWVARFSSPSFSRYTVTPSGTETFDLTYGTFPVEGGGNLTFDGRGRIYVTNVHSDSMEPVVIRATSTSAATIIFEDTTDTICSTAGANLIGGP